MQKVDSNTKWQKTQVMTHLFIQAVIEVAKTVVRARSEAMGTGASNGQRNMVGGMGPIASRPSLKQHMFNLTVKNKYTELKF